MKENLRKLLAVVLVLTLLSTDICAVAEAAATLMLPAALKIIDTEAFYRNKSIEKVVVPDGTTEIRSKAFADSSLTELVLPDSLTFIAEDAFDGCSEFALTVPEDCYAYDWAVENGYIVPKSTATPEPTITPTVTPEATPTAEPTLEPAAFSALVSCNATESFVGETAVWTANAVNGLAPYKYLFKLYQDGNLIATRAYSVDPTYTYSFTETGEYYVILSIKDDNREVVSVQSDILTVGLETLTVATVICNLSIIQTTETATWTASAAGGQAPYSYAFTLVKDGETIAEQPYSGSSSFSYQFADEGDYTLAVTIRDDLGVESEVYELAVPVVLRPIEITSLTANVSASQTEDAVTWTVEAVAGKTPYTYAFEVVADGISQGKSEEQAQNTYICTPELAGTYKVIAYVTDAYNNVAQLESNELAVTTKPLAVFTIAADKDWVKIGDTVTWTTTAVGGVKPLSYAFDVYVDDEELDGCAFTTNNTISYAPQMAGVYSVNALVRDAENTTVEVMGGEVTAYEQITVDSVTADVSECLTGEAVTWTANVTGGKGGLSYYFELYCGETLEYVTTTAQNTLTYAPMHTGIYTLRVSATDENGEFSELTGGAVTVSLHGSSPVEDFTFNTLNGTYCELTGYTGTDTVLVLPEADSEGHIVQKIANSAFKNNTAIRSAVIPDCVETMGSNVFYGCTNLLTVIGGAELTNVGSYAFYGCTSLTSVSLPEGLTTVYNYAFGNCTNLQSIHLPDSITTLYDRVFDGCSKLNSVNYPTGWSQTNSSGYGWNSPFVNCPKLTSIVIPEGVTTIPAHAFYNCSSLTSIDLPSTLTSIGSYAFYGCSGLKAINIGPNVTSIGNSAFYNHSDDLVIYGEADSYAETYAAEQGIIFRTETPPVTTVSIAGRVLTEDYSGLPDVTVYIYKDKAMTKLVGSTSTDADGVWSWRSALLNGTYWVTYAKDGYCFAMDSFAAFADNDPTYVSTLVGTLGTLETGTMSLSDSAWTTDADSGMKLITVTTSGKWYVQETPDWVDVYVYAESGAGDTAQLMLMTSALDDTPSFSSGSEMVVCVDKNSSGSDRSDDIILSNGAHTVALTIQQMAEVGKTGAFNNVTLDESGPFSVGETVCVNISAQPFTNGIIIVTNGNYENGYKSYTFTNQEHEFSHYLEYAGSYSIVVGITDQEITLDYEHYLYDQFSDIAILNFIVTEDDLNFGTMKPSDTLIDFLETVEGFTPTHESKPNGTYVIGYGHNYYDLSEFVEPISEELARDLLWADLAKCSRIVNNFAENQGVILNQHQFDALVSLAYSNCADAFLANTSKLHMLIDSYTDDLSQISKRDIFVAFALWHGSSAQNKLKLYRRRINEAEMFVFGDYSYTTYTKPNWLDTTTFGSNLIPDDWWPDMLPISNDKVSLTVNNIDLTRLAASGLRMIVNSSKQWAATTKDSWISIITSSGENGDAVKFNVAANNEAESRTGTITITCASASATLTIYQYGTSSGILRVTSQLDKYSYMAGDTVNVHVEAIEGAGSFKYSYSLNKYVGDTVETKSVVLGYGKNKEFDFAIKGLEAGEYSLSITAQDWEQHAAVCTTQRFKVDMYAMSIVNPKTGGLVFDYNTPLNIQWESVEEAQEYVLRVRDLTTDELIIGNASGDGEHINVTNYTLNINALQKHVLRIWVGAYKDGVRIAQTVVVMTVGPVDAIVYVSPDVSDDSAEIEAANAEISWKLPDDFPEGKVAFYRMSLRNKSTDELLLNHELIGNVCSYTPSGNAALRNGSNYRVWIAAYTAEGGMLAQGTLDFSTVGAPSSDITIASCIPQSDEDVKNIVRGNVENPSPIGVEKGTIRYVSQVPSSNFFVEAYWKNDKYDLSGNAITHCNLATFSAAISYMGCDYTPIDMCDVTGPNNLHISVFRGEVGIGKVADNIVRSSDTPTDAPRMNIDDSFWTLFKNYQKTTESKEYKYTPVAMYYHWYGEKKTSNHWVLIIGIDKGDPYKWYVTDSGFKTVHYIIVDPEKLIIKEADISPKNYKVTGSEILQFSQWKID